MVDGKRIGATQTKGVVLPGARKFSMNKPGYREWYKALAIKPNTVTNIDYARLVPTNLDITEMAELSGMKTASLSPNGRSIVAVVIDDSNQPTITWGDLRNATDPVFTHTNIDVTKLAGYVPGENIIHNFEIAEWDTNSRFVLFKYIRPGVDNIQWLRFDRDRPDEMIDISLINGLNVKDMSFGRNSDELYALQDNGDLRLINLNNAVISRPLVSRVSQFSVYHPTGAVVFSSKTATEWIAGLWRDGWVSPQVLKAIPISAQANPMAVDISRYFNKDTIIVSTGQGVYIYRGELPATEGSMADYVRPIKVIADGVPVQEVTVSGNGRFVVARVNDDMISFDIERQTTSSNFGALDVNAINWLNDYYLWTTSGDGVLSIREFDGMNKNDLTTTGGVLDASFSNDGKYLFYLEKSGETALLKKISMRVAS